MGKFENEITIYTVCTNDEILIQKMEKQATEYT